MTNALNTDWNYYKVYTTELAGDDLKPDFKGRHWCSWVFPFNNIVKQLEAMQRVDALCSLLESRGVKPTISAWESEGPCISVSERQMAA